MSQLIMNNVVSQKTMRTIQDRTLEELSNILKMSFGPDGSTTCIKKEQALSRYSKDGHTIIGALHYNGIIEQSIKDDVESITRHIVKTVGDGTTSAVILSSLIFKAIVKLEEQFTPSSIVKSLEDIVKMITDKIQESATELTLNDVYDIAMISTNGNEFVSNTLKDIYDEFGNSVFIDVSPSTGEEFVVKSYNGMTLNTGFSNSCYITNKAQNTCEVDHPEVYFFEHPIDTREMGVYLDAILSRNIITPCNNNKMEDIIPTVIFAPTISQDMSGYMDTLINTMAQMPTNQKLPICIVVDYHEHEQLADLARMCGAKLIRKYIDANIYKHDVETGIAPTPTTIFKWCGHCDRVVSYSDKTTFIRPSEMYEKDGSYSELYNNLVDFLETEISKNVADGGDIRETGTLKRRLHSLKSNMVELFVGGITQADRDSIRDLVEDAVLNIRSAAVNGVGLGANMSAAVAVSAMKYKVDKNRDAGLKLEDSIIDSIYDAYSTLINTLYCHTYVGNHDCYENDAMRDMVNHYNSFGTIYNIREKRWTDNVKTSIKSDIIILETVCRIIGIMATCNQFILPTAMHNIYEDIKEE